LYFQQVLKSAQVRLLEPVMRLMIHAEPEVVSKVTQDLFRKRGNVQQVEENRTQLVELVIQPLTFNSIGANC
jgi:translation elongation factor EF-G